MSPRATACRRTWAQLIVRVYGADAPKCKRCAISHAKLSVLTDPSVVEAISKHVRLWEMGAAVGRRSAALRAVNLDILAYQEMLDTLAEGACS